MIINILAMKKTILLLAVLFGSMITNAQCTWLTSVTFSPVSGSNDLIMEINSSCCDVHYFSSYTMTSNGSNHVISVCYVDTGLLMPSDITTSITLTGLNSGGDQNFTINPSVYFGLSGQDCSSAMPLGPINLTLATPISQSRLFQLSTTDNSLRKTNLYPNPNSGNFTLQLASDDILAQLTITDLSGKKIYDTPSYSSGDAIQLTGVSKGLYFAKVYYNQTTETLKFVVQ